MGRTAQLAGPGDPYPRAPVRAFLVVNPRSGRRRPSTRELAHAARERGIETLVLRPGEAPDKVVPVVLERPVEFRIEQSTLRVLVPPGG
jgi:hypothetical protein